MRGLSAIGKTCWDTLLRLLVLEEEASQVDDAVGTIKCTYCGEQSTKEVCLSLDEREFHTRQEPEVHLVKKMDDTPITEIDIKQRKFLYPEEDGEPSARGWRAIC
nr:hypothetical protein [Tanacetum cinerariifolium]